LRKLAIPIRLENVSLLPFQEIDGYNAAFQSAINFRTLQKKRVTVRKTSDVFIGTFCLLEDIILLHDDKDFEPRKTHLSLKMPSP
jgi:hypothetical protein